MVTFKFKDKNIQREVGVDYSPLKIGDTILIRVANYQPYDYQEFVKRQVRDSTQN